MTGLPAIRVDLAQLDQLLEAYGQKLRQAIGIGLLESVLLMVRDVVVNKLRGQYLRRRTGNAIRSITASPRVEIQPDVVAGSFGSNLGYVRAHELGFHGWVQVRAHTRRLTANVRKTKRLLRRLKARGEVEFVLGWKAIAARKRTAFVRAHTMRMHIRARHFFRDTLRENFGKLNMRLRRALLELARTGSVPSGASVRAAFPRG